MRAGFGGTLLLIAVWCAGCASQAPAPVVAAVPPGQAKISITRTDEGPSWSQAANVAINGAHVVDLAPGQTYTGGVPPGPVSITAGGSMDIGHYTVKFTAAPGRSYAFEISKRGAHIAAGVLGGLAGLAIETAANGETSGPFQITAKP